MNSLRRRFSLNNDPVVDLSLVPFLFVSNQTFLFFLTTIQRLQLDYTAAALKCSKYVFKKRIAIVISKRKHIDLMRYHSLVLHKNRSAVTFAPIKYSDCDVSLKGDCDSSGRNLFICGEFNAANRFKSVIF